MRLTRFPEPRGISLQHVDCLQGSVVDHRRQAEEVEIQFEEGGEYYLVVASGNTREGWGVLEEE